MREHHTLWLAGCAGGVDDGSELTGQDLRRSHAIRGNLRTSSGSDESFVAEALGRRFGGAIGDDDVFQLREARANGEELLQLFGTGDENDFGARVIEDVAHALGGFFEIDGNSDAARAGNGEVRSVPFGAIGSEKTDAIPRLDAELHESGGKARNAAEELFG